jgi:hypothetical protein
MKLKRNLGLAISIVLSVLPGCSSNDSKDSNSSKANDPTVVSPYFSGSLDLTDEAGWIYEIQVPKILNVIMEVTKYLESSPPGEASTSVHVEFGNVWELKILPNTPGRTPPNVTIKEISIYRPPVGLKNANGDIPVQMYSNSGTYYHGSDHCDIERTDFDINTDDNAMTGRKAQSYLSQFECTISQFDTNYFNGSGAPDSFTEISSTGTDELLVDKFIATFSNTPMNIIFTLDNGCNISLDKSKTYFLIDKEQNTELDWNGSVFVPRIRYKNVLWNDYSGNCRIGLHAE